MKCMYSSNLFRFLSISLLMCSLFSSAMEPENYAEKKLLLVANQSEQVITGLIIERYEEADRTIMQDLFLVEPYKDDDRLIFVNEEACVTTQQGLFVLIPDSLYQFWVLYQSKIANDQTCIVQKMSYYGSNNIMMIINPDGFVSLAQANAYYAYKKMNGIEKSNGDNALINQEFAEVFVSSSSKKSSSDDSSSYRKKYYSRDCECGDIRCGCRPSSRRGRHG